MYSRKSFINQVGALTAGAILSSFSSKHLAYSKDEIIKIGVIGVGSRGAGLINILIKNPAVRIIAVCDIQDENINSVRQNLLGNTSFYKDYRKLLDNNEVDAVVIATPHYLHGPMAMDALDANKHIYLEKSLSYSIPESIRLVKRAREKSNLVFQVGFQYRNYALYHKVREIVREGWVGKVTHFESQYNRNSNWRKPVKDPALEKIINWRMYREYCGGLVTELCAHPIDAINFITDSHPIKVAGLGSINFWKDGRDTYDNVRLVYEFENEIKSSVTSILSNAYNGYGIRILGDQGTIEIERDEVFIYAEGKNVSRGTVDGVTGATITNKTQGEKVAVEYLAPGEKAVEPTIPALQDFIDCIINKRIPVSNVETAHLTSVTLHMGNMAMDTETVQTWKKEYEV